MQALMTYNRMEELFIKSHYIDQQNNLNFARRIISRATYYGNGNTDGIWSSIFPLSSWLLSFSDPFDDEDGQSCGKDDCRSQSADAYASIPVIIPKYPSINRSKNEIQMYEGNRDIIITINRY